MRLGVEFVDLTAVSIPVELASYVPKNIVKKFCVVPVKLVKDTLYFAMSDPLDFVAPTIRFVSSLIERAFSERASDIHLEPQDGEMVVRMRIDGLLRRVLTVPSELQSTVISRLKIMGGMNIAEYIAASLTLRGWSSRRSVWS